MSQASNGDTVPIHYSGKLNDGTVFDSSDGRDPLEFTIGENMIIPKLEAAVVGMAIGDNATVAIDAVDAYGPRHDDAVQTVERSMIPDTVELTVGKQIQANTQDGQAMVLTVVEANDETVTLDANHPLAGEDLTFDVALVEIVAAA